MYTSTIRSVLGSLSKPRYWLHSTGVRSTDRHRCRLSTLTITS